MKSKAVNQSIIRRARLVSGSKPKKHSLLDELVDDEGNSGDVGLDGDSRKKNRNEGSMFDDDGEGIVHRPASLTRVFGSSISITSMDDEKEKEDDKEKNEDGAEVQEEDVVNVPIVAKEGGGGARLVENEVRGLLHELVDQIIDSFI